MRAGDGISARKECYVMAHSDQLVGKIGGDSLASPIKPRRHALHERRDLRDFHIFLSTRTRSDRNVLWLPKVPHLTLAAKRKIGGETHPVRKFIILYGNSSFRVGDRRQKRDFRAPRIESCVL